MQFVIVTGMSGAGKTTVLKFLEDQGFFCVDNLPPSLIMKFAEICFRPNTDIEKVALGLDIRGGRLFEDLSGVLDTMKKDEIECSILFLDASDDILLNRYKETRRSHPLAKNDRLITGITRERELLNEIKKQATYIIDTTHTLTRQLKEKINDILIEKNSFDSLMVTVMSFGFKYGMPVDSDLVFDVRFIPNPFYIPELKDKTGNDSAVRDYVLGNDCSRSFTDKLNELILFLIPLYIREGKNQLVISIGCTGGKHRSVTFANELQIHLKQNGHSVVIHHRDIDKMR